MVSGTGMNVMMNMISAIIPNTLRRVSKGVI